MKTILITGFAPFGGCRSNPSIEAVRRLPDEAGDARIIKAELPVVFGEGADTLLALIAEHAPDAVLCTGLAGGRTAVTPEVYAVNLRHARIPDNKGNRPAWEPVLSQETAPDGLFTTLPVRELVEKMTENGIPAALSFSAGTYVCNEVMYRLLDAQRRQYPRMRAGFIHVPYAAELMEEDGKNDGVFTMPLADITNALSVCLQCILDTEPGSGSEAGAPAFSDRPQSAPDKGADDEAARQIADLRQQLLEAQYANDAKEAFFSNMSHDIRTPMNAIIGMTALAKKHIDEKSRVSDALNKIETAGGHLLNLINDVLDMSRINSGKMRISEEDFLLGDLLHDTLTIVRPQAEQKGHAFHFRTDSILEESLTGDPLRLKQIMVNIISNAVKYTPNGGEIEVSVSQERLSDATEGNDARVLLHFRCTDNGIGMTPEFLQKIFVPFERVNSAAISQIEGTGLGMSIVKKLIDSMDGTISIDSAPGEGTAVRIDIPLAARPVPYESAALEGRRILIIEADQKMRSLYDEYFRDFPLDHKIAASSSEAVSALTDADYRSMPFSAVIIGNELDHSGSIFDLASYLSEAFPHLTIILASDHDWHEIEYRAARSGIRHFLPLPVFRQTLINTISRALVQEESTENVLSGSPDLTGKNILLVEDNMINREIACEILGSTNAAISTAENGAEALAAYTGAEPGTFALILMDIQMPVMDGYEAARRIRSSGRDDAESVRIVAMTANTFAEDIAKAKEAGMNGHLAKPIDMQALMQLLRQLH